jgi:hypothetical protein
MKSETVAALDVKPLKNTLTPLQSDTDYSMLLPTAEKRGSES